MHDYWDALKFYQKQTCYFVDLNHSGKYPDELIYCYRNNKCFSDFTLWTHYAFLLDEKISFHEYLALDEFYDGDPFELMSDDTEAIRNLREELKLIRSSPNTVFLLVGDLFLNKSDPSCIESSLMVTSQLLSWLVILEQRRLSFQELETVDNVSFYVRYVPSVNRVMVYGFYWFFDGAHDRKHRFELYLDKAESELLGGLMESYSRKKYSLDCSSFLSQKKLPFRILY